MRRFGKNILAVLAAALVTGAILSSASLAAEATFVGASKCKMCHLNEHKIWSAHSHAKAFEVLKIEEQKMPECVGCHTTGAGKPAAAEADLAGVGCESCHGPGSLYKAMDVMNKSKYQADRPAAHARSVEMGLIIPDEKTCVTCHNSKSPTFKGFDFAAAKEKIKHWK